MASRCSERSAMANGEAAGLPEMLTTRRATPANCVAKASTTMPPSEAPTTAESFSMPSVRMTSKPPRAMSSTDRSGKSSR